MGIKLGKRYRDTITLLEGVAVGKTEWLNGCSRIGIQAAGLHEGKPLDVYWVDEQQAELIQDEKEAKEPVMAEIDMPARSPGGPRQDPKR